MQGLRNEHSSGVRMDRTRLRRRPEGRTGRAARTLMAAVAVTVGLAAAAAPSQASVLWANAQAPGSIGQADLDGAHVNRDLIIGESDDAPHHMASRSTLTTSTGRGARRSPEPIATAATSSPSSST